MVDVVLVVACVCQYVCGGAGAAIHTQVEVVVLSVAESDQSTNNVDERCWLSQQSCEHKDGQRSISSRAAAPRREFDVRMAEAFLPMYFFW